MPKNRIKINRAKRLAPKLPMAEAEIWASIPQAMEQSMTGKQIALVVEALDRHWHKAVNHANNEAVDCGYLWSDKHQTLRDVSPLTPQ